MKLDRIHQVSEIVASIAIVASLIFVGIQVSQNTNALKLNAATTNAANWQSLLIARASDRDVIKSFIESLEAPEGTALPEVEEVRLGHFLTADLKSAELNYLQWLDGNLSDELWQTNRSGLKWGLARQPGYWFSLRGHEMFSGSWTPAFQALVDELLPEVNVIRKDHFGLPPLRDMVMGQAASTATE